MTDEKVLEILKAISNPTRLEILRRIRSGSTENNPTTCTCVLEGMEISQSTFSHHVSELVQSGLVIGESQGRFVHLSVDENVWDDFQSHLGKVVLG